MTELHDDDDRRTRRVLWSLPTGLYVVGGGDIRQTPKSANLMTVNLVMQVSTTPRVLAVSFETTSRTLQAVREFQQLSLSVLHRSDRAVIRRFVKPVIEGLVEGSSGPEMAGEPVTVGLTGLPRLAGAAAWLEGNVVGETSFESHVVVFAEVSASGESEGPYEVLRMEDTRMNYGG